MSRTISRPLGVVIGTAFIGSLSMSQLAAASPAFQINELQAGYAIAAVPEGKCGLGTCGVATLDTDSDGKVSRAEAIAGAFTDTQFNAWDLNADGALDDAELKAMHAALDSADQAGKA